MQEGQKAGGIARREPVSSGKFCSLLGFTAKYEWNVENWGAGLEDLIPEQLSPMNLDVTYAYLGTGKDWKDPGAAGTQ